MTIDTETGTRDGTRIGALWAGVLLGPVMSLVALEVGYVLAGRACVTGRMLPVHLTFIATLLVSLAGGALAWREWRARGTTPPRDQGGREGRNRFLAALGLLSAPMFALTIVALWSAAFYYDPCQ